MAERSMNNMHNLKPVKEPQCSKKTSRSLEKNMLDIKTELNAITINLVILVILQAMQLILGL